VSSARLVVTLFARAEAFGSLRIARMAGPSSPFRTDHQQPQELQRKKSTVRENNRSARSTMLEP
jgi:hypothetical protein